MQVQAGGPDGRNRNGGMLGHQIKTSMADTQIRMIRAFRGPGSRKRLVAIWHALRSPFLNRFVRRRAGTSRAAVPPIVLPVSRCLTDENTHVAATRSRPIEI
jgi:hypothetical protein